MKSGFVSAFVDNRSVEQAGDGVDDKNKPHHRIELHRGKLRTGANPTIRRSTAAFAPLKAHAPGMNGQYEEARIEFALHEPIRSAPIRATL